jgi:hypothetical protein
MLAHIANTNNINSPKVKRKTVGPDPTPPSRLAQRSRLLSLISNYPKSTLGSVRTSRSPFSGLCPVSDIIHSHRYTFQPQTNSILTKSNDSGTGLVPPSAALPVWWGAGGPCSPLLTVRRGEGARPKGERWRTHAPLFPFDIAFDME